MENMKLVKEDFENLLRKNIVHIQYDKEIDGSTWSRTITLHQWYTKVEDMTDPCIVTNSVLAWDLSVKEQIKWRRFNLKFIKVLEVEPVKYVDINRTE